MTRLIVDAPSKDVLPMAREYFAQTIFSQVGEFDEKRWCAIWEYFRDTPGHAALLLDSGYAMVHFSEEFIKDARLGDLYQFYTQKPDGTARLLRDICEDWFNQMDCKFRFVSCAAGMGERNNKLFRNLWAKSGYRILGTELYKGS